MNAGELVVSLILSAGAFKAQVQNAQKGLDGVQAAAVDAGRATYDAGVKGAQGLGQSADAASSLQAAFEEAVQKGREISEVTKEYQRLREELIRTGASKTRLDALDDAARKLGVSLKETGDKGALSFERLKGTLTKVLGVIGGVVAVKNAVLSYLDQADALGKYSEALNVNVEDVQAWQEAVKHAGGSAEEFRSDISTLTANLNQAGALGTGRMLPFLQELGIKATNVSGKVKTAFELLPELAARFEKMSKSESMGFGQKLGFSRGTIMLLQQGRKAVDEAIKSGKEFARFTKKDTELAAKANDALQDMKSSFLSLVSQAIRPFIPLLEKLADALRDVSNWVKDNEQFVTLFFIGLAGVITTLMLPALTAMATAAWKAMAPLAPFILIAGALALVIDDLITYIQGGESAFGDFWKMFGTGDEIGARFKALWEGIKSILESVGAALKAVAKFFILIFSLTGQGVVKAVEGIWKGVTKLYDVLRSMLDWVAKKLYNLLPDWIKKWLGGDESSRPEEEKTEAKLGGVANSMRVDDVRPSILPPQVRAGDARPGSVSNVNNSRQMTSTTNVGEVKVYTQATDAEGMAQGVVPALRNQTAQADSAFGY